MTLIQEEEEGGRLSTSDAFMWFFAGIIFAAWVAGIAWIILANWGLSATDVVDLWETTGLGAAMNWGLVAFFGTVLPYLGKKGSEAYAAKKDGA